MPSETACDHKGTVVNLYDSHGGWAEWCWKCGAARSSEFVDETKPFAGGVFPEGHFPWLKVGENPNA